MFEWLLKISVAFIESKKFEVDILSITQNQTKSDRCDDKVFLENETPMHILFLNLVNI